MTDTQYDIIIIGASFGGLTLAHYLPRTYKILIIDSKPALDHAVESTGLITQATYDLLKDFCNIDAFIPNKITDICVVDPSYKNYFVSSTSTPWIYSTDTPKLVEHLAQTVPSNVTLQINTTYTSNTIAAKDALPVHVHCKCKQEVLTYKARFLVGADGAFSRVAKQNNLSLNKRFLVGFEKVFYGNIVLGPRPATSVYHFWFGEFSLGYGGWLSPTIINGKPAFRLGLAKKKKDVGQWKLIDDFIARLVAEKMITIEPNTQELVHFSSLIPINGPLRTISNTHVLLLGDAAGLCGAFAADGIKGAIVSGLEAAKLIPAHLNDNNTALQQLYPRIQTHNRLMTYYRKQVAYRLIWDIMQRNKTFTVLYGIIARQKEHFLEQFCDSKEERKSLLSIVVRPKNYVALSYYSLHMCIDLCILGGKFVRSSIKR